MALTSEKKGGILAQFRRGPADTGSPEVQVALLSERINGLGEHFTAHKRDHSSRRGLVKLVNQRRKLLDYLKSTQPQKYQERSEERRVGKGVNGGSGSAMDKKKEDEVKM